MTHSLAVYDSLPSSSITLLENLSVMDSMLLNPVLVCGNLTIKSKATVWNIISGVTIRTIELYVLCLCVWFML